MIGPAKSAKGGISTVITQYAESGVLATLNSAHIPSWDNVSSLKKAKMAVSVTVCILTEFLMLRLGVIHVHSACRSSFFRKSVFIMLGKALRSPAIFHLHSGEFFAEYEKSSFLLKWWTKLTLNNCSAIIVLSERWRKPMQQLVNHHEKIHVVSNPIDMKLPPDFSRKQRSADQLNLLFLGEIGDRKGIFDLIPVIAKLRKKGLNIRLRCGGNGQIERLTTALNTYHLQDAIDFLGWIGYEQKIKELANADIFILPSHFEGQPMAILEAMMAEVLVVSTTAGSIPDTITNNYEGFLLAPGDQVAMEALLEKIYLDLNCGRDMVKNAKIRVERNHSPQIIKEKLVKIYDQVTA